MKIILVDEKDNIIGHKERRSENKNDITRIAGLWIFNSKNEILIAQRALNKRYDPGKWGVAAAGTLEKGETYISNIIKETREELGIDIKESDLITGYYNFISTEHRYFCQRFYIKLDLEISDFTIQQEEVLRVKWVELEELKKWLKEKPEDFTRSFPISVIEFLKFLDNKEK